MKTKKEIYNILLKGGLPIMEREQKNLTQEPVTDPSQVNCPLAGFVLVNSGKVDIGTGQPIPAQATFSCIKDQCKFWEVRKHECVIRIAIEKFIGYNFYKD
jgi:hypothetical protein